MKDNTVIRVIKYIVVAIINAGLSIGLGYVLKDQLTSAKLVFIVLSVVIGVIFLLNLILLMVFAKKQKNVQVVYDEVSKSLEEESSHDKKRKKLTRQYIYIVVFACVIYILSMINLISCVCVMLVEGSAGYIAAFLLFLALTSSILFSLVGYISPRQKSECIDDREYPLLYDLIEKILKEMGIENDFALITTDTYNFGVEMNDNLIVILLSPFLLTLLSEDEFKSIVYHEIGHVKNNDTEERKIWTGRIDKVQSLAMIYYGIDILACGIFGICNVMFSYRVNEYLHYITFDNEVKSDEYLKHYHKEQVFIDATAKMSAFIFFVQIPRFDLLYALIDSEEDLKESTKLLLDSFKKDYKEHKDLYKKFLDCSLTEEFPTHPNLKQRMENLGVKSFNINLENRSSEQYLSEVEAIAKELDEELYESQKIENDASFKRIQNNRELIKINEDKDIEKLDDITIKKLGDAYLSLYQLDKALTYYLKYLTRNEKDVYVLFTVGDIYNNRNDERCIEYYERSYEINKDYIKDALERIGDFYTRNGMEEKRLELREKEVDLYQKFNDFQQDKAKRGKVTIQKPELTQELIDAIKKCAIDNDCVQYVSSYDQYIKDDDIHNYIIGVRFKKINPKTVEDISRVCLEFSAALESVMGITTDYSFELIDSDNEIIFKNKKLVEVIYNKKEYKKALKKGSK